jgi:hypothetical protein
MIRNFKDIVILLITTGVLILLATIIIGDYIVALEENRPVDESIITLMKMSVTGLIGIIGGYIGGSKIMFRRQFRSGSKSPAWQRKEGKSASGGLNRKGIASYRAANPGSKLSMAVTTKPSKLKKGSKAANRRKSFCARMSGMKKRLTSAKTARDPNSRINKSLRKWNC